MMLLSDLKCGQKVKVLGEYSGSMEGYINRINGGNFTIIDNEGNVHWTTWKEDNVQLLSSDFIIGSFVYRKAMIQTGVVGSCSLSIVMYGKRMRITEIAYSHDKFFVKCKTSAYDYAWFFEKELCKNIEDVPAQGTYCPRCGNILTDGETLQMLDGSLVCPSCYNNFARVCEGCGKTYNRINMREYNGNYYCSECWTTTFTTCAGCGNYVRYDELFSNGNADFCSSRCMERYEREANPPIHQYNYRPTPIFLPRYNPWVGGYGVELEVDNGDDREDVASELQAITNDIYCKDDGSLNDGIEIVSHPATLDHHLNSLPWEKLTDIARENGFRSHNTTTCGLHVHASRILFGKTRQAQDLTIAKIMLLFDKYWSNEILKFSRRISLSAIEEWSKKPDAYILPTDTTGEAREKVKCYTRDRYRAINLCNAETVEFRIFRGTLKVDTIKATIAWVDAIIKFCKRTSLEHLDSTTWHDIFKTTKIPELRMYLENKNLKGDN